MAIKLRVSNPNYNEYVEQWGVQFSEGVGIFENEDKAKEIALTLGYEIVEKPKAKKTTAKKGGAE